jgi:hypothetical protein
LLQPHVHHRFDCRTPYLTARLMSIARINGCCHGAHFPEPKDVDVREKAIVCSPQRGPHEQSGTWIKLLTHILKQQFPYLYGIARHKYDTLVTVFRMVPLNISFKRSLIGDNLQSLHNLVAQIANNVRLNEKEDSFRWGLNQNGILLIHALGCQYCV